jgi:uncharacterized protein (TIGR02145 family)
MKKVILLLFLEFLSSNVIKSNNPVEYIPQVRIGRQIWTAQNLNVDKFRNGEPIPQAKNSDEWIKAGAEGKPVWCYYENDPTNDAKYGKIYNWYAVNDPRGLAPLGWHVPDYNEWKELENYLATNGSVGIVMKSTHGWKENGNGNNTSFFNGLPCGNRTAKGKFLNEGYYCWWWTSTDISHEKAWVRHLLYNRDFLGFDFLEKESGNYVRCIQD